MISVTVINVICLHCRETQHLSRRWLRHLWLPSLPTPIPHPTSPFSSAACHSSLVRGRGRHRRGVGDLTSHPSARASDTNEERGHLHGEAMMCDSHGLALGDPPGTRRAVTVNGPQAEWRGVCCGRTNSHGSIFYLSISVQTVTKLFTFPNPKPSRTLFICNLLIVPESYCCPLRLLSTLWGYLVFNV